MNNLENWKLLYFSAYDLFYGMSPPKIFYFLQVIVVKSVTRKRTGDMRIQHGLVSCFFPFVLVLCPRSCLTPPQLFIISDYSIPLP